MVSTLMYAGAGSATINGQLSSELYFWQMENQDHIRAYERLKANLSLWESSPEKALSLHTYLRWRTDLSDKMPGDPQMYVYDTYLKLKGFPRNSNLMLGRQFVYSAVGSALMDGLRFVYQATKKTQVDIYGGGSVSSDDPEKIRSVADFGVMGGQVSHRLSGSFRMGVNWMLRLDDGSVACNRVGFNARKQAGRFEIYSRVAYNLAALHLADILIRPVYYAGPWGFSGEFLWREPSVAANSLFSLIDSYRHQEFRAEVQRKIRQNIYIVAQFQVSVFKDDNSYRGGFGFRSGGYSLLWLHQDGYGGESNGLQGAAMIRPYRNWELFAGADFHRYRVQEMQETLSDNYAASVGVQRTFGRNWRIRTEGQYLRNAVESSDYRLYFKITRDFSAGSRPGDASK